MGGKNCLNHPNAPAATMCHGCHKPICNSCTMITPMGKFCSSECSVRYRETKSILKEGDEKKGSAAKILVVLLLLIIAGLFGIHFFGKDNPDLKKFDVIGRFMNKEAEQPQPQNTQPPKK